jgi:hypothetical protein
MRNPTYNPSKDQKRYAQLLAELQVPKILNQEERKEGPQKHRVKQRKATSTKTKNKHNQQD